jgi:hypothetical protein
MKTLTPQQIVDLNPCEGYDLQQVTKLFDNKKSMTYLEILNINEAPPWDIIWVFCQPGILDRDVRDQWIEIINTRVARAVAHDAAHAGRVTVAACTTAYIVTYADARAAYIARETEYKQQIEDLKNILQGEK